MARIWRAVFILTAQPQIEQDPSRDELLMLSCPGLRLWFWCSGQGKYEKNNLHVFWSSEIIFFSLGILNQPLDAPMKGCDRFSITTAVLSNSRTWLQALGCVAKTLKPNLMQFDSLLCGCKAHPDSPRDRRLSTCQLMPINSPYTSVKVEHEFYLHVVYKPFFHF